MHQLKEKVLPQADYTPKHLQVIILARRIIYTIYNPIIMGLGLVVASSYIHYSQMLILYRHPNYAGLFDAASYIADIYSNVLNLLFLVRFTLGLRLHTLVEVVLLIGQTVLMTQTLIVADFEVQTDMISILFCLQILCPILINALNVLEFFQGYQDYQSLLCNFNNNFLPVLLTSSFTCIHTTFELFPEQKVVMVYSVLVFSLKFYCLYQYILYEVMCNFVDRPGAQVMETVSSNYMLLCAMCVICGYDLWTLVLISY